MIGDGMGFEQVKAAGIYANGSAGTLSFESFPYQAEVTTWSADSTITDSAAASTAMATGVKVDKGSSAWLSRAMGPSWKWPWSA